MIWFKWKIMIALPNINSDVLPNTQPLITPQNTHLFCLILLDLVENIYRKTDRNFGDFYSKGFNVTSRGALFMDSRVYLHRINCPQMTNNDWCRPETPNATCTPSEDKNWGFCGKVCRVETLPSRLQELHLTVVEDRECQRLINHNGSLVRVNVDMELCAGKNYIVLVLVSGFQMDLDLRPENQAILFIVNKDGK